MSLYRQSLHVTTGEITQLAIHVVHKGKTVLWNHSADEKYHLRIFVPGFEIMGKYFEIKAELY